MNSADFQTYVVSDHGSLVIASDWYGLRKGGISMFAFVRSDDRTLIFPLLL